MTISVAVMLDGVQKDLVMDIPDDQIPTFRKKGKQAFIDKIVEEYVFNNLLKISWTKQ
jgi:hypothetical protein